MNQKMLLRACALYEFDQGHSAAEAGRNIRNTYGEDAISDSNCRKWFARFRDGDRSLEDHEREGRPKIVDRDALKKTVDSNPFLTIRDLEEMFVCSLGTISNALEEIGKVKKLGRWVPHKLYHKLLHDNSRPHVSKVTQSKIEDLGWKVLPHALYSPDLGPTDYHLFRSMQHYLRDVQLKNVEKVKKWVDDYFRSQPDEFYSRGIRKLRERWRKTIDANGEYFID